MAIIIPYHEPSILAAREMTKNDPELLNKYRTITEYLSRNIRYDYIRAATIKKKNGEPDVERTWETKLGICLDTATLAVVMLRAVGIAAYLCIGKADRQNHAWVECVIKGQKLRYDHDGKAKKYTVQRVY